MKHCSLFWTGLLLAVLLFGVLPFPVTATNDDIIGHYDDEIDYGNNNEGMEWLDDAGAVEIDPGIDFHTNLVRGRVIQVIAEEETIDVLTGEPVKDQTLRVRIISGEFKGEEIVVYNYGLHSPVYNIDVTKGDGVIVALQVEEGVIKEAYIADYLREPPIYLLITLFIVALLAIGWRQGAKALCSLLLTMVIVWRILLPGLLRGYHPVSLTVAVAAVATVIAILIIAGFTCKSLAAILGTVGGLVVAGLAAMLVGKAAHLTGFGSEEAAMLLYIPQNVTLDIQGLLFAGIIIGALGAVMDVSMSVSSAVEEVKKANPALGVADLFRSGLNVGRDVMGSMSNTLILAYTGSSVPLLMIFMAYQESYIKMINLDMIASEIVRAFSGSLGMVMVVPLTAFIAGLLFGRCWQPEEYGAEQDLEQVQERDQKQAQEQAQENTRSRSGNKSGSSTGNKSGSKPGGNTGNKSGNKPGSRKTK